MNQSIALSLQKFKEISRRTCYLGMWEQLLTPSLTPLTMQTARHRASRTGHGDLSGSNLEFQIEPGISRTSTYTARSSMADKKEKSTRSFWEAAATMIAGVCINCFDPHRSKISEGHVKPSDDARDVSTTSSKFNFLSSSLHRVHVILLLYMPLQFALVIIIKL